MHGRAFDDADLRRHVGARTGVTGVGELELPLCPVQLGLPERPGEAHADHDRGHQQHDPTAPPEHAEVVAQRQGRSVARRIIGHLSNLGVSITLVQPWVNVETQKQARRRARGAIAVTALTAHSDPAPCVRE